MGLQYVVAKRVFGFDKDKNVKYVAKSVGSGELGTDKLCAKVSRILGIHRKTVDLVAAGLVDIMSEEIEDGKTVRLGDFGLFRPSFVGKCADTDYTDGSQGNEGKPENPDISGGGEEEDPLG